MEKEITVYMTLEGRHITLTVKRADKIIDVIAAAIAQLRLPFKPVNFTCYSPGSINLVEVDLNKVIDKIAHEEATGIALYVIFRERSYGGNEGINPYGSRRFFSYP